MEKRTARGTLKPQCLALVGLPASGKSSVGAALARRLGLPFVDLDENIVVEEGRPIAEIFRADGEGAFRELESAFLDRWTGTGRLVLSTGGGCVLASGNRDLLRERCTVIWLDLSPELAATRASRDSQAPAVRPLLADGDIVERMRALDAIRRPLYHDCADLVIQVGDKSPAAIVEELYAALD